MQEQSQSETGEKKREEQKERLFEVLTRIETAKGLKKLLRASKGNANLLAENLKVDLAAALERV